MNINSTARQSGFPLANVFDQSPGGTDVFNQVLDNDKALYEYKKSW